ncbi:MAG: DNA repair protein RadA [Chloroflexi bacterium]|nr:DNA repair protein RadA [Chloroflexota bacterium]MBU1746631.1 DNA repair protein RadA [Chloroflexota bacterium]
MARKTRTIYVCQQCGSQSPRWLGRCPDCGEWNTLVETLVEPPPVATAAGGAWSRSEPQRLSDIATDGLNRLPVPLVEFDRVLGGGLVPGSLVLIGGDPGIGKSTLLLQVAGLMAQEGALNGRPVLYVSGEESARQIKMRAQRLAVADATANLMILAETNLNHVLAEAEKLAPGLMIVDSIQAVYLDDLSSAAGSVSQIREGTLRLMHLAKSSHLPIFLVGHVTKEGTIAGPRVLEHIVDVVLYLEGERFHTYRLLRSVKNRFGSTNEVGVFEMQDTGLMEVTNPSEAFLAERVAGTSGNSIAVTMEGTRPLLVEVQALTSTTSFNYPRRTANGIDMGRLLLIIAVLAKRVGLRLHNQDVFVNVVGGLKINEPAADLGVALAIASSFREQPIAPDLAVMGEVGLSGELRSVGHLERRVKEAAKLGFKRCLVPNLARRAQLTVDDVEIVRARTIDEALEVAIQKT